MVLEKYLIWDTRDLVINIANMECIRNSMGQSNCQRILINMSVEDLQMLRTSLDIYSQFKDNMYKLVKDESGGNRFIKLEET